MKASKVKSLLLLLCSMAVCLQLAAADATLSQEQSNKFTQFCKQNPKVPECKRLWKDICPNRPNADFCKNFMEDYCPGHVMPGRTQRDGCPNYCRQHPDEKFCKDFIKNVFCKRNPDDSKCKSSHNCLHKNQFGEQQNGFGATNSNSVRSQDGSGPSRLAISNAFNSVQSTHKGKVPPGKIPIENLPDLLSALNIHLSKKELREAKRQLDPQRNGYFGLMNFFFWWGEYILCINLG